MKLSIYHLQEGENSFLFDSREQDWLSAVVQRIHDKSYELRGPLKCEVKITKLEPDYYLRGTLDFEVQQSCARCVESFYLPIRHHFDIALAHISSTDLGSWDKINEESDELDVHFFEGHEIDLSPIVEEQFFLSLPYQSVCGDSCRGLCQFCGVNLNQDTCSCSLNVQNSPFAVLRGYKP